MRSLNLIKNQRNTNFLGFNLQKGALFGTIKNNWKIVPVVMPDKYANYIYLGCFKKRNGKTEPVFRWEKVYTTAIINVVAVGRPERPFPLPWMDAEEFGPIVKEIQDELAHPETFPFINTPIYGVNEEDLKFFIVDLNKISDKKTYNFFGFNVNPDQALGFVRNIKNGKKYKIVFTRSYINGYEEAYILNPASNKWDRILINPHKVFPIKHVGYMLKGEEVIAF